MAIYGYNQPDYSQQKTVANGEVITYKLDGEELEHYRNLPFKREEDGSYRSWNSMNRDRVKSIEDKNRHSARSKRGALERMKTINKRKGNDAS